MVDESVEAELARLRETILALPHAQAWTCQWSGVELLLAVLQWPLDGDQQSNLYILGAGLGAREVLARVRPWQRLGTQLDPRIQLALLAITSHALYLGHMTHDETGFLRKQ